MRVSVSDHGSERETNAGGGGGAARVNVLVARFCDARTDHTHVRKCKATQGNSSKDVYLL